MKKIGIITIHNSPNYGASLQSFALYKYIEQQGYECELIDLHRPHYVDFKRSKKYLAYRENSIVKIKRIIKRLIGRKSSLYFSSAKNKFDLFNRQIRLSRPYCGIDELYADPPHYDLYITGSDQLWNPAQPFCLEPYFLTFAPSEAKKIAYAASIGITELTERERGDFKRWLSAYAAVSVREKQAKALLESFVDREIVQVSDPTFLLDIEYWHSIAVYPAEKKNYILLFTLSYQTSMLDYALHLSRESGLPLICLGQIQPDVEDGSYTAVKDAGPLEFIGYIAQADLVITDSFHGTVFSMIMGCKNFYTYIAPGNKRSSRITDLLTTFHLQDHLLNVALSESYAELNKRKINREQFFSIFRKEQFSSRQFLQEQLQ
ncbi:polysaccharide pyruvyl transferase family protein [Alistipes indistinctus]|uniref:polysaccharide pyruvyl transferase family protein n=1 Tax=Alistipes indistinctus TaxID=626932 RepID=UPI0039F4D74C